MEIENNKENREHTETENYQIYHSASISKLSFYRDSVNTDVLAGKVVTLVECVSMQIFAD